MRILVALSGGIDSSVAAHLLKREGHELIGVRFTLWSDPLAPALAQVLPSKCCTTQNAMRAKSIADTLGIPLHILDLGDEFKRDVVDPFLEGHRHGITPNPCIGCNRTIKFGKLLQLADELGCDTLATGHYARVARESLADGSSRSILLEALDAAKDQSYYLYGLSQEQLGRVLFPLGGMQKREVYGLAEHFGIPFDTQTYRESQDLCFFPEKSPTEFLKRHLPDALRPGPIVRKDGTVIGTHRGLPLYTVGQRKGLGGGSKIPLEVVAKDVATNTIVVADRGSTQCTLITVKNLTWVSWQPDAYADVPFDCRLRSLSERRHGNLHYTGSTGTFSFSHPISPPAPGQCLVMYRGEEVVGGGVIV